MPRSVRLLSRDPTLALIAFGTWAIISGASMLMPGDILRAGTSYGLLRRLPVQEDVLGTAQVLDGLALIYCATNAGDLRLAVATTLSAGLWMAFGVVIVLGGIEIGLLSTVGAWEIAMGIGLMTSAHQAMMHRFSARA